MRACFLSPCSRLQYTLPQSPVVQTLDSAIHQINHYLVNKFWGTSCATLWMDTMYLISSWMPVLYHIREYARYVAAKALVMSLIPSFLIHI